MTKKFKRPRSYAAVLAGAIRLLQSEKTWTKGAAARDWALGTPSIFSSHAKCFCLAGALHRSAGPWHVVPATISFDEMLAGETETLYFRPLARHLIDKLDALRTREGFRDSCYGKAGNIVAFNDAPETKHGDVLRFLRHAHRLALAGRL